MPAPLLVAALVGCAAAEPPRIDLELLHNEPAVRRELNVLQLSRRSAGVQAPALVPKRTLGLTEGRIGVDMELSTATETGPEGTCLRPTAVRVRVRIHSTIYIARELINRPCHGEMVLEHEREHVAIDRRLAQDSLSSFRRAAEAVLAPVGPLQQRDVSAATIQMRSRLFAALNAVSERLTSDRKAAQSALDTPAEYARVNGSCGRKL